MSNNRLPLPRLGVREVNAAALLGIVQAERQTTRTDLLHKSGLSKATVSVIVTDLLERGFVREVGRREQARGRRRVVLEFNPMVRSVLGAQIEDDSCDLVLSDLNGQAYRRTSRPLAGRTSEEVLTAIADGVDELRKGAASTILGLGVGAPGHVDRQGRLISVALSHGWSELPIAERLESLLSMPVVVANRAKVAALGLLGPARTGRARDMIYVFLGTGVVAGLVIDGKLCFGRDGGAGDIGHVTVQPDGALCACGNRGCLHTVASQDAILALARAHVREAGSKSMMLALTDGRLAGLTLPLIAQAADAGDQAACETLNRVGEYLGIAIANLVNTLNPEMVVVGGPGARLGSHLLRPIQNEVKRRALSEAVDDLGISLSTAECGAEGAATLWISHMMSDAKGIGLVLEARDDPEFSQTYPPRPDSLPA